VDWADVAMEGEIGIRIDTLDDDQLADLRKRLTLKTKPWSDKEEPREVPCYREENGYIWLPRHFEAARLWSRVTQWSWIDGDPYEFDFSRVKPDPDRGQTLAIPTTVAYLQRHSGALLVAPTGTGKTFMGLVIGAHLGRCIGVLAYAGHQVDNYTEEAMKTLGLSEDQIGIVQQDRCDLGRPVTIMMVESLLSRRYPDALYQQIGYLCADEVQCYGAVEWRRVLRQFPARYRLGSSADPKRHDGLGKLIGWSFGAIAYTASRVRTQNTQTPTVVAIQWMRDYEYTRFCCWEQGEDGSWEPGEEAHPTKFAKVLAKDDERNAMLMIETANAAEKGRSILVFSQFVDHLERLRLMFDVEIQRRGGNRVVTSAFYIGGMKKPARIQAVSADVIFTTYAMSRQALNVPKLDTEIFATPAGNPLQPIGRMREKAEGIDRNPLMACDVFELAQYSREKMIARRGRYRRLNIKTQEVQRFPSQEGVKRSPEQEEYAELIRLANAESRRRKKAKKKADEEAAAAKAAKAAEKEARRVVREKKRAERAAAKAERERKKAKKKAGRKKAKAADE
jgi:superfamily II DNA or RNA helicase